MVEKRRCEVCEKIYEPSGVNQKYCRDPCDKKGYKTEAQRWVERKERVVKPGEGNRQAYNFFRKKYGVGKMYKVCRG